MAYFDKNGDKLTLNDYVMINADIGEHAGYVNLLQNGLVRVNCLLGEFRVMTNKITRIGHCL